MINLSVNEKQLERTVERARERKIVIPTFEQQKNPELLPPEIKAKLKNISLWDIHSDNLFRITWKNEPSDFGGGFGPVNYMEIPPALSGVKARIIALVGKWFPIKSVPLLDAWFLGL